MTGARQRTGGCARRWSAIAALAVLAVSAGSAQGDGRFDWMGEYRGSYEIAADILYSGADSTLCRLDLFSPRGGDRPVPAVVWFHGGGWSRGTKDSSHEYLGWFLKMGWFVVNANYRLAPAALAPAAVEDSRCVLRWVLANAARLGIDSTRVVLTGGSAGAHLALMAGMAGGTSPFDARCPGAQPMRAAAVINFNGNTNVREMLEGRYRRGFAVRWIGDRPGRDSIALANSPVSYVRKDVPPILTIHGDADTTAPYVQATMLHDALERAGAAHELVTVKGGGHGKYTSAQNDWVESRLREFLLKLKILR